MLVPWAAIARSATAPRPASVLTRNSQTDPCCAVTQVARWNRFRFARRCAQGSLIRLHPLNGVAYNSRSPRRSRQKPCAVKGLERSEGEAKRGDSTQGAYMVGGRARVI